MPHPNPEFTQADLDAVRGIRRTPPTNDGPRTTKEQALANLAALRNKLAGDVADTEETAAPEPTQQELEAPF